jgi:prepilin-type processing-associated H-X9-DG protein/prepilin-type N-terminal cleavage/methylation domain-containing protein
MSNANNRRRFGFTLLELLATMAVIGLLAAMLIPGLHTVADKSRSSKCMSNLRQIGVGLLAYASDHDNRLPVYWDEQGGGDLWYKSMADYLGSDGKIWVCPAAAHRMPRSPFGDTSYGLSEAVSGAKRVTISSPASEFLAGEGNQLEGWRSAGAALLFGGALNNGPTPDSDDTDHATGWAGWIRYRHDGSANMLYMDGHVAPLSKAAVREEGARGTWQAHWDGQ